MPTSRYAHVECTFEKPATSTHAWRACADGGAEVGGGLMAFTATPPAVGNAHRCPCLRLCRRLFLCRRLSLFRLCLFHRLFHRLFLCRPCLVHRLCPFRRRRHR